MKSNRPRNNWIIDAVSFIGFLVCCWLDLTGVALHEWLGLAIGVLAGYHLLAHWLWVKSVTTRFFNRTSGQARVYYLLDASLLLGFLLILFTGLVISTWLALPLGNYLAWKNLHVIVSVITLLLIVSKITIHWRWIITTAHRYISNATVDRPRPICPVPASTAMDRREFLKLMGIVGIATVVPLANGLDALVQGLAQQNPPAGSTARLSNSAQAQGATTGNTSKTTAQKQAATTSGTCNIRCSKNCSYPGRCRKYVDTNKNNRCDLSECV